MDIFDLIGPVMIGPSSSHTAGAARIGLTARQLLGEEPVRADIGLHGSFAKTYRGHGTDRAVVGGLLGMAVDDVRMRGALALAKEQGLAVRFYPVQIRGAHPNTLRLQLEGRGGRRLSLDAASVGGGAIEIHRLDDITVSFSGAADTLIIHHRDEPGAIAAVSGVLAQAGVNIATMQVYRKKAGEEALMVIELDEAPDGEGLALLRGLSSVIGVTFLQRRMG